MTGSDDRAVAGIERLTKQQFEVRTLAGIERPRQRSERDRSEGRDRTESRDRGERGGRSDRGTRGSAPSRPSPKPPADDFFSKPYEASTADAAVPAQAEDAASQSVEATRRPAGRLSALLGGRKK